MILNLKKLFLNEGEHLEKKTTVDLSDVTVNGVRILPEAVSVELRIANHAGLVVMEAEVRSTLHGLCDRCCEPFSKEIAYGFSHIIVPGPLKEGQEDYIEAPDYMLDTDALLRDDILLELPSKFLCKNSCKGLCPKCGKNLNEGKCSCPERETDPRLAVLSKLLEE